MLARVDGIGEIPVASYSSRPAVALCSVFSSSVNSRLGSGLVMHVALIVSLPFVLRYAIWYKTIFSFSCITSIPLM